MGDSGGFDFSSFFGGIIASIVDVINAIISALNFIWVELVAAINFIWNALLTVAKVLVQAAKVVARGFVHLIGDVLQRFKRLFQDFMDLKAKITAWLQPILRIIQRIRAIFNQLVLAPMMRMINLIQQVRKFLVVFRLLGFRWAKRLDNQLAGLEQKIIENTLVLQSWLNFALSILQIAIDPTMIMKRNFLLASLLSALGALKRVVFFGHNRSLSTDEQNTVKQSNALLDKNTQYVHGNAQSGYVFHPFAVDAMHQADAVLAKFHATGSLA